MNPIVPKNEIAVWKVLKEYVPIMKNNGKVAIGVSGGPDSMTLLTIVNSLIERHDLDIKIAVAHFNHSQRGEESEKDAEFVKSIAEKLGLEFYMETNPSLERNGLSSEEALRAARYGFFEYLAKKIGAQVFLLGHNFDDNIETVIMNFLRGSNLRGLAGMPRRRGLKVMFADGMRTVNFLRPLLTVSRAEILEHLDAIGMTYRLDSSNLDVRYKRNWVRNELIPLIQENFNPGIVRTLGQFREQMTTLNRFMEKKVIVHYSQMIKQISAKRIEIQTAPFKRKNKAIAMELLSKAISKTKIPGIRDYRHISQIYSMIMSDKTEAEMSLKDNFVAVRSGNVLTILHNDALDKEKKKQEEAQQVQIELDAKVPTEGQCIIDDFGTIRTQTMPFLDDYFTDFVKMKTDLEEFVDIDKLKLPLSVRFPRPDDMFLPLGQKTERRLNSFLKDCKIPFHLRDKTPLLVDSERIIWVIKYRLSESVKFEEGKTKQVLRISFQEK